MTEKGGYKFVVKSTVVQERVDETDEDRIVVRAWVSKANAKAIVEGKHKVADPCELYQEDDFAGTQIVTFTMPVPHYDCSVELGLVRAKMTAGNEFICKVELPLRVACKYAIAMFAKDLAGR